LENVAYIGIFEYCINVKDLYENIKKIKHV